MKYSYLHKSELEFSLKGSPFVALGVDSSTSGTFYLGSKTQQ